MHTRFQGAPVDELFSQRKKDHVQISLSPESQASLNQFDKIQLAHNPLPEIDFEEVDLSCDVFGHNLGAPLFVSSMTLGHEGAHAINERLMQACRLRGWMMGVGSQRRQLFDEKAQEECRELRQKFPELVLFGNIGLSQVISSHHEEMESLVEALGAQFLVVHTNPLQEAIQPEGTPQFRGGKKSLKNLAQKLSVPLVLKETGCGFSKNSLAAIDDLGLAALDVSGLGGTHWGRVEGLRQKPDDLGYKVASTFSQWGVSTVDSLHGAKELNIKTPVWASGGVRTGLDAAKLLVLGAEKVGLAQPLLAAAMESQESLVKKMEQLEQELRVAMFCLGAPHVQSMINKREWVQWI